MEKVAKPGYIILLTLLVIAAIVAMLTTVVHQSFSFQRQARIAQDKARARMLALSSLEIAASQLSTVVVEEEKQEKDAPKKEDQEKKTQDVLEPVQKWLLKVLPFINHWQTIVVNEDGLEGTIKLYLACEEGKFNLAAFKQESIAQKEAQKKPDDKKQDTQQQDKKKKKTDEKETERGALQALDELFKKVHDTSMYEAFKRLMTDYKRRPENPTELLRIYYGPFHL